MFPTYSASPVTHTYVRVTPELAAFFLEKNTQNFRKVNKRAVARLAADMAAGRYCYNGGGVTFDTDNILADGQHRLHAIVQSGTTAFMNVVTGIQPEATLTIDKGRPRTFADLLAHEGFTADSKSLGGAIRLFREWERGFFVATAPATDGELMETFYDQEGFLEGLLGSRPATRKPVSAMKSVAFVAHYIFNSINPEATAAFFVDLGSGVGLRATDPVYRLRNYLLSDSNKKANKVVQLALYIKAWNARAAGRELEQISFRKDENFPAVVGWPHSWPAPISS